MAKLLEVRTGHAARVNGHLTAYRKSPRTGPVRAHFLGLEGDEVANTRVHGGPEKAIYACSHDHYAVWQTEHPQQSHKLVPGGFGENLLIEGLTESKVCIGDRWRIGTMLVEPCQPRQPCATLARWFDDPGMVKAMIESGRSGWYLRVIEEGSCAAGDAMTLEHRPQNAWSIAQVLTISYGKPPAADDLSALAALPGLATGWSAWAGRQAVARQPKPKPV